jgi:hypothetical protein
MEVEDDKTGQKRKAIEIPIGDTDVLEIMPIGTFTPIYSSYL